MVCGELSRRERARDGDRAGIFVGGTDGTLVASVVQEGLIRRVQA